MTPGADRDAGAIWAPRERPDRTAPLRTLPKHLLRRVRAGQGGQRRPVVGLLENERDRAVVGGGYSTHQRRPRNRLGRGLGRCWVTAAAAAPEGITTRSESEQAGGDGAVALATPASATSRLFDQRLWVGLNETREGFSPGSIKDRH